MPRSRKVLLLGTTLPLELTGALRRPRYSFRRRIVLIHDCKMRLNYSTIAAIIMLNVLVTGADGQLGRSLRHFSMTSPNNYIYMGVGDLDITDADAVKTAVKKQAIDVIINCAAYTDVERAEENEAAADLLNHLAVKHLADAAARSHVTFIHVSTDYVFDGSCPKPYTEDAPTAPLGVYGRTKLAGERAIMNSGCKYLIFRTAWLYSEHGNNFLKTMLRLTAEKETLKVVSDQIGTPTYAGDLARMIISVVDSESYVGRSGIYHFTGEGVCSWYDFAVEIAAAVGHDKCLITSCRTTEFPTKAPRPAYSVLDKTKIKYTFGIEIPHWRESMLHCLNRLINNK